MHDRTKLTASKGCRGVLCKKPLQHMNVIVLRRASARIFQCSVNAPGMLEQPLQKLQAAGPSWSCKILWKGGVRKKNEKKWKIKSLQGALETKEK